MSNEISKEQKLTAIVVAHPSGRAFRPCALERIHGVIVEDYRKLYFDAAELGFSYCESLGIMNGWDGSSIPDAIPRENLDKKWLLGYELGQKLRRLVVEAQ